MRNDRTDLRLIDSGFDVVRGFLAPFLSVGLFTSFEIHAAHRVCRACLSQPSYFDVLSVASAAWATQQGHVCMDLDDLGIWDIVAPPRRPDMDAWRSHLGTSMMVHHPQTWSDSADITRPLVSFGHRLYLARQWEDERSTAHDLALRRSTDARPIRLDVIDALFAEADRGSHQHEAVIRSIQAPTSILTGGPGTGKTYTIARILVAAVQHGITNVALAAPTAKAAVQMRESLSDALTVDFAGMSVEGRHVLERLEPTTIHRLLGRAYQSSTRFRYHRNAPLPHDMIVIDEMSMVSLPLMARLLEAIEPTTTLVLVGDPGQLDSVEVGSILRDLVDLDLGPSLPITVLETGRRNAGTRSSTFASLVRAGAESIDLEACLRDEPTDTTLRWIDTAEPLQSAHALNDIVSMWRELAILCERGEVSSATAMVNNARVLCAHRDGKYGVTEWNATVSQMVSSGQGRWRPGDIVVKTRNDLGQGLANGDTGVVVIAGEEMMFAFIHGEDVILVPCAVDEAVELAFATTVHKAQGSEFTTVVVVVPPPQSPLCTRELLYTALTRAKPDAVLLGTLESISHAAATQRQRYSGLADRLAEL